MSESYRLSVQIDGRHVEVESQDREWVEAKFSELKAYLSAPASQPLGGVSDSLGKRDEPVLDTSMTVPEFYQKYIKPQKLRSRPDIALFFVYYLQKIAKEAEIKSSDVAKCFGEIGYANYNKLNYADILSSNRKKGLLNYVNSIWTLTMTGQDYVLNRIASSESNESK